MIFLSGCIIQSRQLNGVLDLIRQPSLDLSETAWSVRYANYESIVYAVSTSSGILFSNQAGDQILFDGWMISQISGLGRRGLTIKINEFDGIRHFEQGRRAVTRHKCQEWQRESNLEMVSLSQSCSNRRNYTNQILILADGRISMIRQIVDERYTALTLTKLE